MTRFRLIPLLLVIGITGMFAGCGSDGNPQKVLSSNPDSSPDEEFKVLQEEINILREELKQERETSATVSESAPAPSTSTPPSLSNEQYQATLDEARSLIDQINILLGELKTLREGTETPVPINEPAPTPVVADAPMVKEPVPEPVAPKLPVEPAVKEVVPVVKEAVPAVAPEEPVVKEAVPEAVAPKPIVETPALPVGGPIACTPQTDTTICLKLAKGCGTHFLSPAFIDECGYPRGTINCRVCVDPEPIAGAAAPAPAGRVDIPGGIPRTPRELIQPPILDRARLGGLLGRRRVPEPAPIPRLPAPPRFDGIPRGPAIPGF